MLKTVLERLYLWMLALMNMNMSSKMFRFARKVFKKRYFFEWFSTIVMQAFLSQVHPISTKRESIRVSHLLLLFCWSVPSKFVDLDTESFCSAKVFSPTRTFPSVKWGPSNLPSLQSLVKSCTGFIGSRHWLYPHLKYKYRSKIHSEIASF